MAKAEPSRGIAPTRMLWHATAFVVGIAIGAIGFTFVYAKGTSYLSNDPSACINCHIMEDQHDGWMAGPHANVATCNDCHLPHGSIVSKYLVKAENGFSHSAKFTTGRYPENIVIRDQSLQITNQACLYCHADLTDDVRHPGTYTDGEELSCVRCHSDVGHQ